MEAGMSLQTSGDSQLAPSLSYMANDRIAPRPVSLLGPKARMGNKSRQKSLCWWADIVASLYFSPCEPGRVILSPCEPQVLTC